MTRFILLALAVLVFFWLLRRALSGRKRGDGTGRGKDAAPPVPELVACAHCGVHLPRHEALAGPDAGEPLQGRFFCSEEHLRLGPR